MFPSQFPNKNGRSEEPSVIVTDEQGRSLKCNIVKSAIELEDQEYLLLLPVDNPVEILTWPTGEEDDENAIPVESEEEIDLIFDLAKVVLAEQNLTLKRTAVTLTVAGELPDFLEEEEEELSNVDLDSSEGEPSEDEEYEELWRLATFYQEEQEYGIYALVDPFYILARMDENGEVKLLSPQEYQQIEPLIPLIEDKLFDDLE